MSFCALRTPALFNLPLPCLSSSRYDRKKIQDTMTSEFPHRGLYTRWVTQQPMMSYSEVHSVPLCYHSLSALASDLDFMFSNWSRPPRRVHALWLGRKNPSTLWPPSMKNYGSQRRWQLAWFFRSRAKYPSLGTGTCIYTLSLKLQSVGFT